MDRIYARSEEKFVKTTILYISKDEVDASGSDPNVVAHAFLDQECTQRVDARTLEDLFLKGVLFYVPLRGAEVLGASSVYMRPAYGTIAQLDDTKAYAVQLSAVSLSYAITVVSAEAEFE